MEMLESVLGTLGKAVTLKGTATRSEFWYFQLFLFIATIPFLALGSEEAFIAFGVVTLIPAYSVQVRRLHDVGKSGWWMLLFFVPFGFIVPASLSCLQSKHEDNPFIEGQDAIPQ